MSREEGAGVFTLDRTQFCSFRVAELLVGIDVQLVQEVIRAQEMRTVPLAPSEVKGLINLRGQIVTAIDLRQMLGLPPRAEEDGPSMNVVVRYDDEAVSILVDEAGDVVELTGADFEPVPPTVATRLQRLASGAFKLDGSLVLVLDVEATVKNTTAKTDSSGQSARSPRRSP
jgi:purine-binding chemotaxis protein CheW